ncbi:MAG: hypothetical protein HYZ44_13730 [Bacteroidetes bacterium]|nr:hypothetical protein [Bacteroidota bacterium]
MTLQKGFLRKPFAYQDLSLSKHHVWMYAGIWLTGSIVIFFLLITIKESYRFISYTSVVGEVFTLSKSEAGFFSFFYACLACFFSFSLVVSHILSRPSALKEVKSYRKRAILNNLSGYQGYFIFWYFKMAVFWGILNFVIPVFLFISFTQEYTYLFLAMLVVLSLNYWLTLRLVFKNSILKVMAISTLIIFTTAFFLSQLSFANGAIINKMLGRFQTSAYVMQDLPTATHPQFAERKNLVNEIFAGALVTDSLKVGVFYRYMRNQLQQIDYSDLHYLIENEKEQLSEYENNQVLWTLYIDKNVQIKDVKKLREVFRRNYVQQILWGTHLPGESVTTGIREKLWPLCNSSMAEPCIPRNPVTDFEGELMEVHIAPGFVTVNGQQIRLENLITEVKRFQSKNSDDNVIAVTIEDEVRYGFYFDIKDKIRTAFHQLRDEETIRQTSRQFDELDSYDQQDRVIYNRITFIWPVNVLEAMDEDEKAYLKSLKARAH